MSGSFLHAAVDWVLVDNFWPCALLGSLLYYLWWFVCDVEPNKLFVRAGGPAHTLLRQCPAARETYVTNLFFPGGWLNTFGSKFGRLIAYDSSHNRRKTAVLKGDDGGTFLVDWFSDPAGTARADAPVVLILPGNLGGTNCDYFRTLTNKLVALGYHVAVHVRRGCGTNLLTSPAPQHYGGKDDLDAVVAEIKREHPKSPLVGAGFSLGGNYIARYAASFAAKGKKCPFTAVVSHSCPWHLYRNGAWLPSSHLRCADGILRLDLVTTMWRNRAILRKVPGVDFNACLMASNYVEAIEYIHAPIHGFKDSHDLLTSTSAQPLLDHIDVPLLCINAIDDPFVPHHLHPIDSAISNPHIACLVTKRGGHLAYGGINPMTPSWGDEIITQWVMAAAPLRRKG